MKRFFFIALMLLCAAACTVEETVETAPVSDDKGAVIADGNYYSGVVTVKFTEEMAALIASDLEQGSVATKSVELNEFVDKYGITSFERVFKDDPRWTERHQREGLHLWYRVRFDPSAVTVTKAAGDLAEVPGVILAEPCPVMKQTYYWNDPYYYMQYQWVGTYGVNIEDAWEYYATGDPAVIVAIDDGGIIGETDIEGNLLPGGEGLSWNFVSKSDVITPEAHGIFCGGMVSAVSNNGLGGAGAAGGNYAVGQAGVRLMSCQIIMDGNWADCSEAFVYSADNGALISSNSWGYSYSSEADASRATCPSEIAAGIDYFNKYAGCDNNGNQLQNSKMKGGLVFFSAGNDGWAYAQPAEYEGCLAVGATTESGARASFSCYGDWVDICAPGERVVGPYYDDGSYFYVYASGTSMSCPIAAGVAALAVSYYGGYGFTADDLKTCLLEGANHNLTFDHPIGPLADAVGALSYFKFDKPDDLDSYSVSATADDITFTWKVPAGNSDKTEPAYGMLLCASKNKSSIDNLNPKSLGSDVVFKNIVTEDYAIGEEVSGDIFVGEFNTTFYVTCVPFNRGPAYANAAPTKTVTTKENSAPTITPSIDLDNLEVRASGSVSIRFTFSEPDGHDFTSSYKAGSIAETWTKVGDDEYLLTIKGYAQDVDGNYISPGNYTAVVSAVDAYGAENVLYVKYAILDNEAPYVLKNIDDVLLILGSSSTREAEFDVDEYFADADGDALSYTVSNTSPSTVQAVVNAVTTAGDTTVTTKLYLTAMRSGTADVTVTAKDARGLSCSLTVSVAVRSADELVIAYPNPFSDVLYVSTGADTNTATEIVISSSTGSVVYSEVLNISAFNPAKIDATSFAPGTYSVKISYSGSETTKKVVKK